MSHCANAVSCKKACIHWLATTALIERKVKVELCLTQKIIYGSFKDCILASSRQTPKNIRASRNHGRGTRHRQKSYVSVSVSSEGMLLL